MRIGELARRTGVSPRSLRYYEQRGLLHARRTANGYRTYDEPAVNRVKTIADLLARGLTVEEVRQLEPCLDRFDPGECADPSLARETYQSRLAMLDERLASLRHRRDQLAELAARLPDQP